MNLLETLRSKHEDLERFQLVIREELEFQPSTWKESVQQTNVINHYLERIIATREEILKIYEDADGTRKEENNAMQGTGAQVYSIFYDKVKDVRNYHRQFPNVKAERPEERIYTDIEMPPFTSEEGSGKYLDLHEIHQKYLNLKSAHKMDYYSFLDYFYRFNPKGVKDEEYKKYLNDLLSYLIDFIKRSMPLERYEDVLAEAEENFAKQDTENPTENGSENSDPLFCKACNKKFTKDTVFSSHLTGKKHIKAAAQLGALSKECLLLEQKIAHLTNKCILEHIENSKLHIEKKIARGSAMEDSDEEDTERVLKQVQEESDEEVEIITTKQNYPIGWDGKPIPFWLYKLHGLGIEYRCEICGNCSYWGRKAYEMHFQEWRHAHGMKCLGIPNTSVFRDITKINDALMLWQKICRDNYLREMKNTDADEEFEDTEGNVFNKKIYMDLKRQGLL